MKVRRGKGQQFPPEDQIEMTTRRRVDTTPPASPVTPILHSPDTRCLVCEGHIHDWLILPLVPEEEFAKKIRPRALKRAASRIAALVYRIVQTCTRTRVEAEYCMKLTCEGLKYNPAWLENRGVPTEHYPAFRLSERKFLPQVLESLDARSDMQALRAVVEDWSCLKRGVDVDEWLGSWFLIFWDFIPALHLEHQGLKPATGGGPAPGLRSHQPQLAKPAGASAAHPSGEQLQPPPRFVPPPPPLNLPPIQTIADISTVSFSTPSVPCPLVKFDLDELYS